MFTCHLVGLVVSHLICCDSLLELLHKGPHHIFCEETRKLSRIIVKNSSFFEMFEGIKSIGLFMRGTTEVLSQRSLKYCTYKLKSLRTETSFYALNCHQTIYH